MTGLTWTMQILNYPLLALLDPGDVPRYEQAHNRCLIWLLGPGLTVTAVTIAILLGWRPSGVPLAVPVVAMVLLAIIIADTIRHGAPWHACLAQRFDAGVHTRLVRTNWIRTVAWSALGVLDLIALARCGVDTGIAARRADRDPGGEAERNGDGKGGTGKRG